MGQPWQKYQNPQGPWAKYQTQVVPQETLDALRAQNAVNDANLSDKPGVVQRAWNWASTGLVSPSQFLQTALHTSPLIDASSVQAPSAEALKAESQRFDPRENPFSAAVRRGTAGALADTAQVGSSQSSPLAIGTALTGGAAALPGRIGTAARLMTAGSAVGFGAQGAGQIEDAGLQNTPEAWQQRLMGAGTVAGSLAGGYASGKAMAAAPIAQPQGSTSLRPQGAQASFVKEYLGMHPKAVQGVEHLFDAAAPTGMQKGARANLAVAAGDLAEIGQNIKNVKGEVVPLSDAKGGIINPDMRPEAVVQATREHLAKMYAEERAPQIQRNADKPVAVGTNPNAARGLEYLASSAGDVALEQLAQKALDGKVLTVAEADKLAVLANQELKSFEKMTPEGKTQAKLTNPKIGGLKALDSELSNNLNQVLTDSGEVGLRSYERRFAALSNFRDMLEARKNAVELQKPGVVKKIVKPVASMLTGGKAEIASASQAAVADVNIGRSLEKGFRLLKESGVKPKR